MRPFIGSLRARALAAILFAAAAAAGAPAIAAAGNDAGAPGESGNLIAGGDAEAATCTNDWRAVNTVPGWTVIEGSPSVLCTAAAQLDVPKGAVIGTGLFADGPYGDSALRQTVDVSAAAAQIDDGAVGFRLHGLLGGWAAYPGQATVTAAFLDGHGHALGAPAQIGPVTAAQRHNISALLQRETKGAVPQGTRRIAVTLRFSETTNTYNDGYADNLSLTISARIAAGVLAPPVSSVPRFDHVFLVMMENTDFGEVIGNGRDAPFINGLAAHGTSLLAMSGVYHPSDENYLAIAGGDTFVEGAVYFPAIHVASPHIGDMIEAAGKTWRAYEQGMGIPCNLKNNFDAYYQPDDAPFINFVDIQTDRRRCQTHLVDTRQLAADLRNTSTTPNFAWIAADDYFDGEGSGDGSPKSVRTQDRWLKRTLTPILNSAAWLKQRSLLILTWDESQSRPPNHIGTILVGSQGLVHAGTSKVSHDHYSTGRTIEAALGLPPLTQNDRFAQPVNEAFGR